MTGRDETVLRDVLTVTEEHPFWVRGHGELPGRWVKAAALVAGDVVESAFDGSGAGQVVVESVEPGEVAGVYNFAVEGDATYFVGKFATWVHNACSPNQMNQAIQRGQAPAGMKRIDRPKVPGEKLHAHLDNGSALNVDGTWKHGSGPLSKAQGKWLKKNGWTLP
jgi:hypothetical protein